MNILNRRMFAIGGQTTLGPYDIRDNETGKVTTLTPGFLDNVMAKSQYAYPLLNGLKVGQLEMGDGVYQLLGNQNATSIQSKTLVNALETLDLYGIESIFIDSQSLRERNLTPKDLALNASIVSRGEIAKIVRASDSVFNL